MGDTQCKTPFIPGNTLFILLSGGEAKTGRHQGQESCWRTVRVQQSYCSPSHLQLWLHPHSSQRLISAWLLSHCVWPVLPVRGHCVWAHGSSWQQPLVTGSGSCSLPKTSTDSFARIKQEYFSIGTSYRLSEKRFFPPACYKTILNGDCNLSTLNKWGSCILKLISHHQALPNNNNCIADGPVSRC